MLVIVVTLMLLQLSSSKYTFRKIKQKRNCRSCNSKYV